MLRDMKTRRLPRTYASTIRSRHSEQTRHAILDGLAEQLSQEGARELSIPKVAARAGVSVRTVYRYFPTREALLDALSDWVNDKLGHVTKQPETADELVALPDALFPAFAANAELLRAQMASPAGRQLRLRAATRRRQAVERALGPITAGLDAVGARRAGAAVHALFSDSTLLHMKDVWGLDGYEAAQAATWALRLLVAELRKRARL
jgi:AcrR family transcriptional regulator